MQVISVSIDTCIHVWDGLLPEDWIDHEMTTRQLEYCDYTGLRVLMCSWNIDSIKPAALSTSIEDAQLLADIIRSVDSPDIIVFGFQEMIDLSDKKLTASSFRPRPESDRYSYFCRDPSSRAKEGRRKAVRKGVQSLHAMARKACTSGSPGYADGLSVYSHSCRITCRSTCKRLRTKQHI